MTDRREYEMTEADLNEIMDACRPVPLIMLQCGMPPTRQERANNAWAALGKRMGFEHMSVRPSGKGNRFFTAVPVVEENRDE
jgi:hypothetical protein